MSLMKSWVDSANSANTPFPLNNLPYGVFSTDEIDRHCGVAIGDMILDVTALEEADVISIDEIPVFDLPMWNEFMDLGAEVWAGFRASLQELLGEGAPEDLRETLRAHMVAQADATMHMPFVVSEYTDFYAGKNHAFNVGTMFRGPENALPPNWLHIPIGYNGRASSVVVSGTDVRRPWGQLKGPNDEMPRFAPCARFDLELEMGAIVGQPSEGPITVGEADQNIFGYVLLNDWSARDIQAWEYQPLGPNDEMPRLAPCARFDLELEMGAIVGQPSEGPITVGEADQNIFGYVLLNDWSARDIQAWEYQPLGPFQAKATATTISPWIVTAAALEPFRTSTPEREKELLPYLTEPKPGLYDIDLEVTLAPAGKAETTIARTNYSQMYYSAAQQLAHHTTSGCAMTVGDLLGSGTISGPTKPERGSLLELSWGGKEPLTLDTGEERSFLEDGDTLTLKGAAKGDGYQIGFGDCAGTVLPALDDPYKR